MRRVKKSVTENVGKYFIDKTKPEINTNRGTEKMVNTWKKTSVINIGVMQGMAPQTQKT
jgi:hypothetical protein